MHFSFDQETKPTHRLRPPCARQCRCFSRTPPFPLLLLHLLRRLLRCEAASRPPRWPQPPPPPAPTPSPWEPRTRRPDCRRDAREDARSPGGRTGKPVEGSSSWSSLPYSCGRNNGSGGTRGAERGRVGVFEVGVGKGAEMGGRWGGGVHIFLGEIRETKNGGFIWAIFCLDSWEKHGCVSCVILIFDNLFSLLLNRKMRRDSYPSPFWGVMCSSSWWLQSANLQA